MNSVKAHELAYVRIQVPDFAAAEKFFHCFGLRTSSRTADRLYLRGTGREPYLIVAHLGEPRLLATGFELRRADELERASRIEGASSVQPIDGLGGGWQVTLTDPEGNGLELVHGIKRIDPIDVPQQQFNSASGRDRRRNAFIRPSGGPSRVLRLGHVVVRSPDVAALSGWYCNVLGLLESDEVLAPVGDGLLMSSVRLNQGNVPVDHHVMQILHGEKNQVHHISFEVQDIDDLFIGHDALAQQGYRHVWGIGAATGTSSRFWCRWLPRTKKWRGLQCRSIRMSGSPIAGHDYRRG